MGEKTKDEDGNPLTEYFIHDHLGNLRVSFADRNGNGFIDIQNCPDEYSEVLQINHYYPFGLEFDAPYIVQVGPENPYQYNGIEKFETSLLDFNHAFYRTLDPAVARWWQLDPMAEDFYDLAPYNSMGNSPALFSDPDGDWIHIVIGAIIGAGINVVTHWDHVTNNGTGWNWGEFGKAAGIGAAAGALTATGIGAIGASTGAIGGVAIGAAYGLGGDMLLQTGNHVLFNDPISAKQLAIAAVVGGVSGGIAGYLAVGPGRNPWTGQKIPAASSGLSGETVTIMVNGKAIDVDGIVMEFPKYGDFDGLGGGNIYGANTALRPVGKFLESVNDVMANPYLLSGKSLAQVRGILNGSKGWIDDVMRRSSRTKGWVFREVNKTGTDFTGRMIQYHPGTPRHFGGTPYWKVSSGSGIVKIPLK